MCLAVPGKLIAVSHNSEDPILGSFGTVDFQGTRIEVSLQLTPQAVLGDWVLVHAGFALQTLNEAEAREIWQYLKEADLAEELPVELATNGGDA